MPALQLAGHGHAAVPSRHLAGRGNHRSGAALQCRRPAEAPRAVRRLAARASARRTTARATASRSTSTASRSTRMKFEVANLSGADGTWANLPASWQPLSARSIDPELGRIALPPPLPAPHRPQSRFRITTASTPIWAAANTRAATASWSTMTRFVFPFPDAGATYPRLAGSARLCDRRSSPSNGAVAVEIDEQRNLSARSVALA